MEAPTRLVWSPLLSLTQPSSEAGRLLLTPSLCPEPQEVGVRRGQEQVQLRRKRAACVCARAHARARAHACVCMCVKWPSCPGQVEQEVTFILSPFPPHWVQAVISFMSCRPRSWASCLLEMTRE